jgi:hypothetical protein
MKKEEVKTSQPSAGMSAAAGSLRLVCRQAGSASLRDFFFLFTQIE